MPGALTHLPRMTRRAFALSLPAALAALLGLTTPAVASDGVLEINQVCVPTGCFPGDAPGLPVTLSSLAPARSFRLTSDLVLQSARDTAIEVTTNAVTVDLGGFRIVGPNQCSGVPVSSCSPGGEGVGVLGGSDVTVRNGTIQGMGDDGVALGYSGRVEGLHVLHNGGDGISVGDEGIVWRNVVTSNGGDGIRGNWCVVRDDTSTGNRLDGIDVFSGTVSGSTATLNGGRGGQFGPRAGFAQNLFSGNALPDVDGGHATGGNVCGDSSCSVRGARRFYLTRGVFPADQALGACAAHHHMASMWELTPVAGLEYDIVLGMTLSDSGSGPPSDRAGWVRTGAGPSAGLSGPGVANCQAWSTTSGGHQGTRAKLALDWDAAPSTRVEPWDVYSISCALDAPTWCVED